MVSTAVTSLLGKKGMVDILFSNECLKAGVQWSALVDDQAGYKQKHIAQVRLLSLMNSVNRIRFLKNFNRWVLGGGYQALVKTLQHFTGPIRDELEATLPKFSTQLQIY